MIIGAIVLLCASFAYAKDVEEQPKKEFKQKAPIVVNGDKVEYFHEQKKVVGVGNISIDYQDVRLTAEKVTVYLDTREAIAEGNVKITQKDAYFTGDRMNYNFDTRVGKAIDAYVNYVPFYGKSKDVEKVNENLIDIQKGYITTCDLEHPHYRIEAKQVRIYLGDKVIANCITFYVGNCPILYLPYYVQPLKEESSHITVMAGHDSSWGYYALTSMKFDYSQIFRGRFRVDYRTKNGYAGGVDNFYSLPGLGDGIIKFYYAQENNKYFSYEPVTREEGKYRLQVRHKWQMNSDTLMTMELNKQRDENMVKYYFLKEWEEQQAPDNYVSIITTKPNYNTTFLTRVRMDKYYDVVQRLPEYKIEIPQYNIKGTPFYYNGLFDPVYLQHAFPDHPNTSPMQKDQDVLRLDTYNKLSYPIRVLRAFNFTPYAGTRQTYYSRNKYERTNIERGIFDTGVDFSTKFYKVYDINTNFMDININKIRHIITPTATYYYTHQPTVSLDNLMQFDEIDALKEQNGIRMQLENRLQTKRAGQSVNLLWFLIGTDFQYKLKQDVFPTFKNSDYKTRKFTSVDMQLELTPYPWIYALSKMSIDTKHCLPSSASVDFVGGKDVDRSLALGYRYEHSFDPSVVVDPDTNKDVLNFLTFDWIYKICEQWKTRVYWRVNMDKGYLDEQLYTIYRDLHCWTLEFSYDFLPHQNDKTTMDQIFWFALRLKAFPNQPLGIRRTYSRTRAGEMGDSGFSEHQSVGFSH